MKKTVAAIYTGYALVGPGRDAFSRLLPDVNVFSILDDSLIGEVIEKGKMTDSVLRRLFHLCTNAVERGADVILETCSSVGASVDFLQPFFDIPIVRIDEPMIQEAIGFGGNIGVLATLPTTLDPTCEFVEKIAAKQGLSISIVRGLAEGAFEAITNGDAKTHDDLILKTAKEQFSDCEAILLAQGSMARMEDELKAVTGKPVLSSLERGILALKKYL